MCFYSFHFLEAWSELKLLVEFPVKASHLFSKCNHWQAFDWPLPLAMLTISAVCLFLPPPKLYLLWSGRNVGCGVESATWRELLDCQQVTLPPKKRRRKRGWREGEGEGLMYHFTTCLLSVCSGHSESFFYSLLKINRSGMCRLCSSSSFSGQIPVKARC